ncbi:hypothetical protein SRABI106_03708 [Rahnella aquatilis]|nr:hypothetical protein SRABI106_03708 [Rahnella aquatilis]
MDTLNLHVEQAFRIHHNIQLLGDIQRQPFFVVQLGLADCLQEAQVIQILFQFRQLAEIRTPGLADGIVNYR